jgi:hypothetical protein
MRDGEKSAGGRDGDIGLHTRVFHAAEWQEDGKIRARPVGKPARPSLGNDGNESTRRFGPRAHASPLSRS